MHALRVLVVVLLAIGCKAHGTKERTASAEPVASARNEPILYGSGGKPMPKGYASIATSSEGVTMRLPYSQIGAGTCADLPCLMLTAERPEDGARLDATLTLGDNATSKLADLAGASFTTSDQDSLYVFAHEAGRVIDAQGHAARVTITAVTDTFIDGVIDSDLSDDRGRWHLTLKFHAIRNPNASDATFAQVAVGK